MTNRNMFSVVWFCLILMINVINLVSSQPLAVDCGSKGGKDEDDRNWEPDTKYLVSTDGSVQVEAGYQDPSLLATVPYMNARMFKSPATYKFPIKPNERYLLRFHFYPSTYPDFNITNSFFSVAGAGVTLLSNFSAAITCQALTQAYLVNEYSLAPSKSDVLNVTFTPSNKYTNSFAFVNGIELIAMPNDLFGVTDLVVGYNTQNFDIGKENLQMMFRLNVGGQSIPPSKDAGGLLRSWYNDVPYLYGAAIGITPDVNKSPKIDYKGLSKSAAPADVYRTARTMGNTNLKFNLTWTFQVDANFTYIVRVHLCELELTKTNQKTFNIYINNQSAQADPNPADIIAWTGGKGVPTYKDYAIIVLGETVRIDINPSTVSKPQYFDAQLNGVEIFKLADDKENLAGNNPQPSAMLLEAQSNIEPVKEFKSSSSNTSLIGGATGGAAAAVVVVAILFVVYSKKKRVHGVESHTNSWLPIYGNSNTTASKSDGGKNNSNHISTLAQGLSRHFSISEIKQATNNFDESNVIGVGGFGKVYKGVIDGGVTKVAIKRSNPSSEQGINEFQTEIEMLSKLRHKHLVSLIGFCEDGGEMCLVYDYMALGTLREHIYGNNNIKSNLTWKQRLEICIGAARGLHYLHTGAKYTIIHRDVKTTNILLDENWVAKVSDFGLSKTGPDMMNQGHVSTVVKGSFGYLDPEYFRRQQLTEKSDVYSFGVVLFEVVCARPVLNPSLPKEQVSLADWALHCQRKGMLEDIVDPHLRGKINPECLKKFADTAEKCLSDHGLERPHMGDVLWNLEFALQLQETADGNTKEAGSGSGSTSDEGSVRSTDSSQRLHVGNFSHGSDHELEEANNESAIFSQLVNPKGR